MNTAEFVAFVKKNPITVGCGVLSLALGVGIYLHSGTLPDTDAELRQKTAEADKYAANIKNSSQLKEQLDVLTAANKEIDSRLVHNQLGVNYQFFYKLFADTGVKQIELHQVPVPAAKVGKGAFIPVGFSVAVQGDQAQLLQLLHTLESGVRYCHVLTATCNANAANRSAPLTLSLTLELLGVP
jgi:hypothetical protein